MNPGLYKLQNQPSKGVLRKWCSENIPQIYRRTPMLCNFIEIALRHGCSHVNLLHIFRAPFYKNTYGGLLLKLRLFKHVLNPIWYGIFYIP